MFIELTKNEARSLLDFVEAGVEAGMTFGPALAGTPGNTDGLAALVKLQNVLKEGSGSAAQRHEVARDVLRGLVDTVEATGGIRINPDGTPSPIGDPEWIDLGTCYERACEVLNHEPVVSVDEDADDVEEG